jgi:hypothetical protein
MLRPTVVTSSTMMPPSFTPDDVDHVTRYCDGAVPADDGFDHER